MKRLRTAIRAYPFVFATLLVAIAGLLLLVTPAHRLVPWLVSAYAIGIAVWQAIGMIRSLLRGHAGLDILAVTAIVATVAVGEYWAALVVVLMLTGGEALEDYAQHRSQRELTALLSRAPQQARREIEIDGAPGFETIDVDDVAVGDVLLVRPGELVPVDAVLLDEAAAFDESSLTGESLPVERVAGEMVASGAVNGRAAVRMRAAAVADDSQYQQIVTLVREAQESRATTVRLADRYAVPFTLLSLAIAAAAWVVSGEAVRFAEVLVVATPCPLLIAAPVAFLGGMSRAAKAGLIVKGGSVLEQLARVRSVAFDKTGTLTTGRPEPRRVEPAAGFDEDEVLRLAASAEVYSSHVLSGAVIQAAKLRDVELLPVEAAEEHATNGVAAHISSGVVRVGKPAWIAEHVRGMVRARLEAGELAIYVSLDDRFVGTIVMRDRLRGDAANTVAEMRALGVERMAMVTGDVAATAAPFAAEIGIEEVHAECRPADKVRIIAGMGPRPLMMVGDGLNDAPVLAAADVGFAMGAKGATAASESAGVVNRFDRISGAAEALKIGRDTVRIALQSIWLGIVISVGLMVVAALGFLPALVGAWLQEAVDLIAILGALRALRAPGHRSGERRTRRR